MRAFYASTVNGAIEPVRPAAGRSLSIRTHPFPQVSLASLQMAQCLSVVRGDFTGERVRSALYRAYRVESFVEGIGRDDTLDAVAWP